MTAHHADAGLVLLDVRTFEDAAAPGDKPPCIPGARSLPVPGQLWLGSNVGGRTLNHSFIILDEAQNCTSSQMKMFLTRLGASSKAVITGDVTQTDLAPAQTSGLKHAWELLRRIEGIRFVELTRRDIVRHRLVQQIVDAYQNEHSEER